MCGRLVAYPWDLSGRPEALTQPRRWPGLRYYVIPDLALVAFLITLFYCLFLFTGYQKLFRDSDAGWHIRTGESILSTRALPHTDPYSFTRSGQPWFAWEWGSDALTGAAYMRRTFRRRAVLRAGDRVECLVVVPA